MQATSPLLEKIQTLCNASTSRDRLREQRAGIAPARGSLEETEWEYLCATARQAAPLFDRLGRLMADFAPFLYKFDSLRHDHAGPRSESSVSAGMASTTPEREPAPSQPYHLGPGNTPTSDPYNWLIGTSNTPPRTRPNNIDIHIHAILAPQQRSTTTASPIQPAPAAHSLPSTTTISSGGPPSFTSPIRPSSVASTSTPTQAYVRPCSLQFPLLMQMHFAYVHGCYVSQTRIGHLRAPD